MVTPNGIQPVSRPRRLVVLCDGTWCGRETNTVTNIELLARMMGVPFNDRSKQKQLEPVTFFDRERGVKVGYFDGIGLGKSFLEYVFDGATATTIGQECIAAYEFIAKHYDDSYEIWMFGLSRGAYTVRSVAGMINNCGIVRNRPNKELKQLCKEVYEIYRSPYEVDKPNSTQSKAFRENKDNVWQVKTPIKFMGLLDTVASLGIPQFNPGVAGNFDYPHFYDQEVSSEVEKVYQALSLHDRLWAFQPCLASRNHNAIKKNPALEIVERWFPGCHYDLGRQRFTFIRNSTNVLGAILGWLPKQLSETIEPNEVLSDLVLRWMLQSMEKVDPSSILIPNIAQHIERLTVEIIQAGEPGSKDRTGTGDVYSNVLPYAPFGIVLSTVGKASSFAIRVLNAFPPGWELGTSLSELLGVRTVLNWVLATRDRRIPNKNAVVEPYTEPFLKGTKSIAEIGKVTGRYKSQTYQSFEGWRSMLIEIPEAHPVKHKGQ